MDLSEILRVCRAGHKLQAVQFWGQYGRNSGFWITFKIFVIIALKRAYGNRWQSKDGDAT